MKANLALGKAGELRVASELLLRGYEVFMASVDSGVDLILANGNRIQVKTARRIKSKHPNYTHYVFTFKSWKKKEGHYKPHSLEETNFVILWPVEHGSFFIIPKEVITGKFSIQLGLHERTWSEYSKYEDNWDLLNERR